MGETVTTYMEKQMVNRENCIVLADFIESYDKASFAMGEVYDTHNDGEGDLPECGTAACIAGFCQIGHALEPEVFTSGNLPEFLGVDGGTREAKELIMPNNEHALWTAKRGDHRYVTRPLAVQLLRHMAVTGRVDWGAARARLSVVEESKRMSHSILGVVARSYIIMDNDRMVDEELGIEGGFFQYLWVFLGQLGVEFDARRQYLTGSKDGTIYDTVQRPTYSTWQPI